MSKRTFWLLAGAILVVLVIATVLYRSGHKAPPKSEAAETPSASVVPVERGTITHLLGLAGQFQPYQVVDVHPKVSGFIRNIYVDIGDKVRAGQILAVLEVPELKAQLQGTVAQVARSKDEIIRAQHEVARTKAMYAALNSDNERMQATAKAQPGLIAQQELDDTQAKALSASAQVDAAEAALAVARGGSQVAEADNDRVAALQDYTKVVAPLDGVIVWRYADTGALIQSGTGSNDQALPIVRLAQSGLLRLRMAVPEDAVRYIKIGDTMQIRVDAMGRSFTGKVVRFTRSVNFETRTMQTEVDVENKNLSIDPGMYADTQLQLEHAENVLTIPVEALIIQGNGRVVYAVDSQNRVQIRTVTAGIQGSTLVEIKSGLQEGDRVIVGGQEKYQEGEEVRPEVISRPSVDTMHEPSSTIDVRNDTGGAQ